ncbi:MAG: DUF975 family protein, partial [Oscillospiraceae bacterium]|nr:DUF975 family protein [Oscillospiraceae bacterium]
MRRYYLEPTIVVKRKARRALRPAYWSAFLVCLMAFVLYGYVPDIGGGLPFTLYNALQRFVFIDPPLLHMLYIFIPLHIFLVGPLTVGRMCYFLNGIDGEWQLRHLFSPFRSRAYFNIVFVMGLRLLLLSIAPLIALATLLLGNIWASIFLGIPFGVIGLIAYYHQRLTPYLLAENPKMRFGVTMQQNKALISYDMKRPGLFAIDFSFYTWYIVGALFFGVGQFFFMPYHDATMAARYRELCLPRDGTGQVEVSPAQWKPTYYGERYSLTLCLVLVFTLLLGLFPITTANAHAETEFIVTTEWELREAVEQNQSPIRVDSTIRLTEGTIYIEEGQDIVLRGTGALVMTISGRSEAIRHFSIRSGRLTLQEELSLRSDAQLEYAGGVESRGTSARSGYFIMEGGRIEYNHGVAGGGVAIHVGGVFQMHGGVIRENHTTLNGGGVFLFCFPGRSRFLMTGGEISGNTAETSGGGVSV